MGRIETYIGMDKFVLDDDVDNLQGVAVQLIEAESRNPEIDEAYRVRYIPDENAFPNPSKVFKVAFFLDVSVITDRVYPAEALTKIVMDSSKPGQPEEVLHISHDEYGRAPYREKKIGDKIDDKIVRLQEQNERLQGKLDSAEIDNLELEQENDLRGDEPPSKQTASQTPDDIEDELEDLMG